MCERTEGRPFAEKRDPSCCHVSAEALWKVGACTSSQRVGEFSMNLGPTDRHIARGSEAQLHPIPFNLQHNHLDVLANEDSLAGFSAKNQHVVTLRVRSPVTSVISMPSRIKPEGNQRTMTLAEKREGRISVPLETCEQTGLPHHTTSISLTTCRTPSMPTTASWASCLK